MNNLRTRFNNKVANGAPDSCWEWLGAKHRQGYGWIGVNGKTLLAHRVSWGLKHGRMPPKNKKVCHHCDNPPCVNPDHLFLGTQRDNVIDCVSKGRAKRARNFGSKNGQSKLTEEQAVSILADSRPQKEISKEYGVAISTISMIQNGHNWPHLNRRL